MSYRNYNLPDSEAFTPRALLGGAFALILLMAVMLWMASRPEHAGGNMAKSMDTLAPVSTSAPVSAMAETVTPSPPIYRYSVIPGGVRSATELAAAIARDPVIRAHYADVNVAAMRAITVDKTRMVHVSYRIGDQIYWTRNKVRLVEGEVLLTDGTNLIRARCGNRIADEVLGMMRDSDPATEELQPLFTAADEDIEQHPNLHGAAAGGGQSPGLRGGSAFASDTQASPLNGGLRNPGGASGPIGSVPGFMNGPGGIIPVSAVNVPAAPGDQADDTIAFDPLPAAVTQPGAATPGGPASSEPQDPLTPVTPGKPGKPGTPGAPFTPMTPNGPTTPPGITTPSTPVLDPETPDILTPEPPLVFAPPPTSEPIPPVSIETPGSASPIPEPGNIALFALAALALLQVRRRAS